jgi:structure-specific endonuclease subunit SLX1
MLEPEKGSEEELEEIQEDQENCIGKPSFVYLLVSTDNSTYVGATVDLERRLRQHNKEIKGGAFATGAKVSKGQVWRRAAYVSGFPNWTAALQFEWSWKNISRKYIKDKSTPLQRRMKALKHLLALEKPTSKAIPYSEWVLKPDITFEIEEASIFYNSS